MTAFLADLARIGLLVAALFAVIVVARRPVQWLIDRLPAPLHRLADLLGFCEVHP